MSGELPPSPRSEARPTVREMGVLRYAAGPCRPSGLGAGRDLSWVTSRQTSAHFEGEHPMNETQGRGKRCAPYYKTPVPVTTPFGVQVGSLWQASGSPAPKNSVRLKCNLYSIQWNNYSFDHKSHVESEERGYRETGKQMAPLARGTRVREPTRAFITHVRPAKIFHCRQWQVFVPDSHQEATHA